MSKILTRQHFNLPANLWDRAFQRTADAQRITSAVDAAVNHQSFISIIGQRGSGKSDAVKHAIGNGQNVRLVSPLRLTREKLHLGDIELALVRDLSDEPPRRSAEARSHQVRRILGDASRQASVLLLIDDAHVLHHSTLRGLKRLREFTWLGQSPLLGIVLVGQFDRAANIPEVGLRSDLIELSGLSQKEIQAALIRVLGSKIDAAGAKAIAAIDAAKNWLDLHYLVDLSLAAARAGGARQITAAIVAAVLRPVGQEKLTPPPADDQVGSFLRQANEQRSGVA